MAEQSHQLSGTRGNKGTERDAATKDCRNAHYKCK